MPPNPDFWGGFPPKPRSVLRNRQGIPRLSGVSSRADGVAAVTGKRDGRTLLCVAYGIGCDQFRLLRPCPARSGKYPDGARINIGTIAGLIVITRSTDDRSIPITGKRDGSALLCPAERAADGAGADQLRLLGPHPARARKYPRRTSKTV